MGRSARSRPTAGSPPGSGPIVAVACGPALLVQACWRTEPALRTMPLAIAMPNGRILACCPLASQAGVQSAQQVAQARLGCPQVTIRPPDHEAALALYERLLDALATCSPAIEAADAVAGVAYLDAGGLSRLWGGLQGVAGAAVRAASGSRIRASAGIGPTRLVALALARRADREDGLPPVLLDGAADAFLHDLPLDDAALGLPPAVVRTLSELGVSTAGALAELPHSGLALRFGHEVLEVWHAARGLPEPPLRPWTPPARLAVTHRDEDGLADWTILEAVLRQLTGQLASRLRARAQATATLTLSLRCADGAEHLRRARHWPPLHGTAALTTAVLDLLAGSQPAAPVETLEVRASDLVAPDSVQHGLWDDTARDHRGRQLAAVLQMQARRNGRSLLRQWRPDPLADDGWSCEEGTAGS